MTEPTDDELDAVIAEYRTRIYPQDMHPRFERAIMRAAIAKWGTPPPKWEPVAWNDLTDEDRERAMNSMPGMLEGFTKTWGWLHFAKAIEAICREKNAQPAPAYKDSTPELHVGDSAFESWYSTYSPAHKGDKQRARDAYAAGMGDPLATAAPVAVAGSSEFPHEKMDAVALGRYKVVSSDQSMFYRFAVVAGDGAQQLYIGREVDCQNMARKFAGAFLDGAFAHHSMTAAPTTQLAPQQEARPVTPYTCPKCHALWLHWPAEQSGFGVDTLNCRSATHCDYCEKGGVEQLERLERVPAALKAPQQEAQEPVYAFRRKGLDDFCTCTEKRYTELSAKPNLFETRIFYTHPSPPEGIAGGWMPIETAPKDGTPLLLRSKKGRIADGQWITATSSHGGWAWAYVNQEPVEWRPLSSGSDENRELRSALIALLTHMGMDEDEWNRPTFDQARRALGVAPPTQAADSVLEDAASAGFFLRLPQRPKPEAPAGTVGLDWDAYSGAQMLAYGRDCSNAAIVATQKQGGL